MKKYFVGLLLGTMGLMLVACGSKDKAADASGAGTQATENASMDTSDTEIYESEGMPNPWVDSDQEGVLAATGFRLVAPEGAVNVAYSYMPSTGMAQMNFNVGNAMCVYRVQTTDGLEDISGIYCDWDYTEKSSISGMEAMLYGCTSGQEGEYIDNLEITRVVNWYDAQNKVTYSFSTIGTNIDGMDNTVFAEELYHLSMSGSEQ